MTGTASFLSAINSGFVARSLSTTTTWCFLRTAFLLETGNSANARFSIVRLICVDEVQDLQDLQYGNLAAIHKAADRAPVVFFVGDARQSIYESLGALTKTPQEIAVEFGLEAIEHLELRGNYSK